MIRRLWLVAALFALNVPLALRAGAPVKDFTLPSATDGSLVRLADYGGKVVLINWWRTDCQWSQRESPKLVALYQKYRNQGFVIVGVSDDTAPTVGEVPAYLKRYGIVWPVGLNDQGEFMREIRPQGRGETPGNYLVSRSGEITYLGLDRSDDSWRNVEEAVARAVAQPAPVTSPIPPQTLSAAPAFSLPDLQGKPVKLQAFAGKPLVVNFFTAQTCDWAGATLSKLYQTYAARGLQIVGIDLFDQPAQIQSCVTKHAVGYPVLRGDEAAQQAWIGESKGWATFFVTADGKVFKKIADSIDNGLEGPVFSKYAEYLLAKK